ncbi:MAG: putative metal-binding motif-containing protein [Nanoarchaeota archaeon]
MKKGVNPRTSIFAAIGFVLLIITILILSTPTIFFGPYDGTTSSRSFGSLTARSGFPLDISLNVEFEEGTPFYDIVEYIPSGFQMDDLGGGSLRPDLDQPESFALQLLNFAPENTTHNYTVTPWGCAGPYTFDGLYLAPPETTRQPLGETTIIIEPGDVTRNFLTPPPIMEGDPVSVALNTYIACEESYHIEETVPASWIITNPGGGSVNGNTITWDVICAGPCSSVSRLYEVQAPIPGQYGFTGIYSMDGGPDTQISGDITIDVLPGAGCVDLDLDNYDNCDPSNPDDTDGLLADCNDGNSTINPGATEVCTHADDFDCDTEPQCTDPDCDGQFCTPDETYNCFNNECLYIGCTMTDFYCAPGPSGGSDIRYPPGDIDCDPPDTYCYWDLPEDPTCGDLGGICGSSLDGCDFMGGVHYPPADFSCTGGTSICCVPYYESCTGLGNACLPDPSCFGSNPLPDADFSCEYLGEGNPSENFCCERIACDSLGAECWSGTCPEGTTQFPEGNADCYTIIGFDYYCCG